MRPLDFGAGLERLGCMAELRVGERDFPEILAEARRAAFCGTVSNTV
jgi:hypothetical protein